MRKYEQEERLSSIDEQLQCIRTILICVVTEFWSLRAAILLKLWRFMEMPTWLWQRLFLNLDRMWYSKLLLRQCPQDREFLGE